MWSKIYGFVVVLALIAGCSAPQQQTEVQAGDQEQSSQQAPVQLPSPSPSPSPSPLAERAGLARADLSAAYSKNAQAGLRQAYPAMPYVDADRENYLSFANNGVLWASQQPVSTFSIDVDTASYANVRRMLNLGQLPVPDAVRVEELINYFQYNYPRAEHTQTPFSLFTELGPSPWQAGRHLLHVGINGWQPDNHEMPPANLVFLIDVSGSMQAPNKMGLLKSAMKLMVRQLRPQDHVAIVVYAGASGQVLAPTPGDQKVAIEAALEQLQTGGSTNGEAGITLAYSVARQHFKANGVNRVILATDGDFNVGTTDVGALERLVEQQRASGVELSVLGFGSGNYNDHLMQKIAQVGNGNAAYIDNINEARKVLVDELGATLDTIAKDVKVQIEFNPDLVETYRLIGYETRHLNREDFNNDRVDAGEIGAGHTVTALYEITLKGAHAGIADPLRYTQTTSATPRLADELGYLKLRYKTPGSDTSRLVEKVLYRHALSDKLANTSETFRFSAAVAWLGQIMRNNTNLTEHDYAEVITLAANAQGADPFGYRSEFINLARTAQALSAVSGSGHAIQQTQDNQPG